VRRGARKPATAGRLTHGAIGRRRRSANPTVLPRMVPPQLTELVDEAPDGPDWLRETNFDGYRMHARLDRPRSAK
jgi:ATP-dependent DNA ligase